MADIQYRIDKKVAGQMAVVCFFFDFMGLVAFIPGVGTALDWLINACAEAIFYYWLGRYNISYFKSPTVGIATGVEWVVKFFFGFLPATSLQIGIIVSTSWAEDAITAKTGVNVSGKAPVKGKERPDTKKDSREVMSDI